MNLWRIWYAVGSTHGHSLHDSGWQIWHNSTTTTMRATKNITWQFHKAPKPLQTTAATLECAKVRSENGTRKRIKVSIISYNNKKRAKIPRRTSKRALNLEISAVFCRIINLLSKSLNRIFVFTTNSSATIINRQTDADWHGEKRGKCIRGEASAPRQVNQ